MPLLTRDRVAEVLRRGDEFRVDADVPPRFRAGDRVRARNIHPFGHTRLPRYVRGRPGRVVARRGVHVFPDSNAGGAGEDPRWLYSVAFEGPDLWGPDGDPTLTVYLDLWEPYLERA